LCPWAFCQGHFLYKILFDGDEDDVYEAIDFRKIGHKMEDLFDSVGIPLSNDKDGGLDFEVDGNGKAIFYNKKESDGGVAVFFESRKPVGEKPGRRKKKTDAAALWSVSLEEDTNIEQVFAATQKERACGQLSAFNALVLMGVIEKGTNYDSTFNNAFNKKIFNDIHRDEILNDVIYGYDGMKMLRGGEKHLAPNVHIVGEGWKNLIISVASGSNVGGLDDRAHLLRGLKNFNSGMPQYLILNTSGGHWIAVCVDRVGDQEGWGARKLTVTAIDSVDHSIVDAGYLKAVELLFSKLFCEKISKKPIK
jgi:hypothetical protein